MMLPGRVQKTMCYLLVAAQFGLSLPRTALADQPALSDNGGRVGLGFEQTTVRANDGHSYNYMAVTSLVGTGTARLSLLRRGDIIYSVDNHVFGTPRDLRAYLHSRAPGTYIHFVFDGPPNFQKPRQTDVLVGEPTGIYGMTAGAIVEQRQDGDNVDAAIVGAARNVNISPFKINDTIYAVDGQRFHSLKEMNGYIRSAAPDSDHTLSYLDAAKGYKAAALTFHPRGSQQNGRPQGNQQDNQQTAASDSSPWGPILVGAAALTILYLLMNGGGDSSPSDSGSDDSDSNSHHFHPRGDDKPDEQEEPVTPPAPPAESDHGFYGNCHNPASPNC